MTDINRNPAAICLRVILGLLNVLYLLFSVGVIGFAVFAFVNKDDFSILIGADVTIAAVIILLSGVLILVMSIVGLVGAITNFWPILAIYSFLLILLLSGQLTVTVLSFVYKDNVKTQLNEQLKVYITNYTVSSSNSYNEESNDLLDAIQEIFKCCGRESYTDWRKLNFKYFLLYGYPDSCACTVTDDDDSKCKSVVSPTSDTITVSIWKQGCKETLDNFIEDNLKVLGGTSAVCGAFLILTFALSIGLVLIHLVAIRKNRTYSRLRNQPVNSSLQEITYATEDPNLSHWDSKVV